MNKTNTPKIWSLILILWLSYYPMAVFSQYPNQSFSSGEVGRIISPQMSNLHLNQPSAFKGYVVMAGNAVHEIWNIRNPYNPTFVKRFSSAHAAGEAESHQVTYMRDQGGNYYLVTVSGRGIDIWNITNPTNPIYTAELILPGINYGDVSNAIWGLSAQGNYIYVGATNNGVYVVDASNKANPSLVNTVPTSNMGGVFAGPLFAQGNLLIVTTPKNHAGIVTLDITDAENPTLLDSWSSGDDSYIGNYYEGNAFLIDPLRILDVTTDPKNIQLIHTQNIPNSEYTSFDGGHLFLGGLRGGTQGIYKYDINNLNAPFLELRIPGRDARWDDQFNCPIGNIVVIGDDQNVNGFVGGVIGVHDTQPDTKAPEVKYIFPAPNASAQPLTTKIGIAFSDWIEFASVDANSFILRPVGGTAVAGSWGNTYTNLSFAPDQPLQPNTTYELILSTNGITDLVGNGLTEQYVSTFTTGSGNISSFTELPSLVPITPIQVNTPTNWGLLNADTQYDYEWDAGDGTILSGLNPRHRYATPGRYPVTLSVYARGLDGASLYQAEEATLSGNVTTSSNHTGYSGSGFVDFPATQGANVYVEWTVNTSEATTKPIVIQYALGSGTARPLELSINGGNRQVVNLTNTGSWDNYVPIRVENIALRQGANKIRLSATAGSVGPNIDFLSIENGNNKELLFKESFTQIVYETPTTTPANSNTQIVADEYNRIWVVNQDANTISALNKTSQRKIGEVPVGEMPVAVANASANDLWVLNKKEASISIVNKQSLAVVGEISLPYASEPCAIVFNQNKDKAYIALENLGVVLELNTQTRSITNTLSLSDDQGCNPAIRGVSIDASDTFLYVSRFISSGNRGEIYKINLSTFRDYTTLYLAESMGVDEAQFARGIPNYITDLAIHPSGKTLWAASKKDNIRRGLFRDGLALEHDNTVRAIVSLIDLPSSTEQLANRKDFDDSDRIHATAFNQLGDLAFLTKPGNNEVLVVDGYTRQEIATIKTAAVPVYTYYEEATSTLYVLNFLGRSVSIYNLADIATGGTTYQTIAEVAVVANELLSPQVLAGKKLFYDAFSNKMNDEGYLSCASCHLDGGQDGQIWDFTSRGEGLRNTIDLRGKAGMAHGRLHWTGNFDEVHDFENQIREFSKGSGLMSAIDFVSSENPLGAPKAGRSAELDALAAYVTSLKDFGQSPYRKEDGSLTATALAGKQVFINNNCQSCHGSAAFTDSPTNSLHHIGTTKPGSGKRAGATLTGFDTPTLKGLWRTAPYLHDGSAKTLAEAIKAHTAITINDLDLAALVDYLKQIDDAETIAASGSKIQAKVFLEGFYNGGDRLTQYASHSALLPNTQPFNTAPWNYRGNERATTIPAEAVDWILLVTRDVAGRIQEQKAGFLTTSGALMDVNGTMGISVANSATYFSIHHKSHLAVMSATPYTNGIYDFTTSTNQAMGNNQLKVQHGKYVLHCGDYDGNGNINAADFNNWASNSAALNQYLFIDGDGNGVINATDYNLWVKNKSKLGHSPLQF